DASTVAAGYSRFLTATANFSGSTTLDVTGIASWESSNETLAIVNNGFHVHGRVMGRAVGTPTITAYFGGTSGSTGVTVTNATLSSIDVTPDEPSVNADEGQLFTATGTFSDASTKNITHEVQWTSSDETYAVISNHYGDWGWAIGVATGSAVITATDPRSGVTGTETLTVN
ncbi:MAG: hypothetical protein GY854_00140, partial [Deltaproteobacteria bacterium]|nr:hypothetical protein [Deltaproteobacteria bacterium]